MEHEKKRIALIGIIVDEQYTSRSGRVYCGKDGNSPGGGRNQCNQRGFERSGRKNQCPFGEAGNV